MIILTKKLIRQILPVYKKAVEELPKVGWLTYLIELKLHIGVCFYVYKVLDTAFYVGCDRIDRHITMGDYWGKRPCDCRTRSEAIKALQLRIDIMEKELKGK